MINVSDIEEIKRDYAPFPELTGTRKQVIWAKQLRYDAWRYVCRHIANIEDGLSPGSFIMETGGKELLKLKLHCELQAFQSLKEYLNDTVMSVTDSRYYIAHRDKICPDYLQKAGEALTDDLYRKEATALAAKREEEARQIAAEKQRKAEERKRRAADRKKLAEEQKQLEEEQAAKENIKKENTLKEKKKFKMFFIR